MHRTRHGRSSDSRRRAFRPARAASAARRPRLVVALAVACAGLAVAFWLPTRNDSASATETAGHRNSQGGWGGRGQWDRGGQRDGRRPQQPPTPPAQQPTTAPTSVPPSSEPPATLPPTTLPPTTEPPATTPPPTTPPTTPPATTPPPTRPAATKWAAFTDYKAGQIVTFDGIKYEVLADHTSLPGWEPPAVPSLFKVLG